MHPSNVLSNGFNPARDKFMLLYLEIPHATDSPVSIPGSFPLHHYIFRSLLPHKISPKV